MTTLPYETASARHVLASLRFLAEAIDAKDPYTRGHVDRVARYCMKALDWMPERNTPELREQLLAAALLHDIGKLRVPDSVLKKPGKLTTRERLEIELHPVHACTILGSDELAAWLGPAIRAHHEKLDGSGYPDGLRGDDIPLAARIIAVADIFDACTSKRVYRKEQKAHSDADALAILDDEVRRGHLDPEVVAAFHRAYDAAHVSLARAASYAYSANPLATNAGGEERAPLAVAREVLEEALGAAKRSGQPERTIFRITARLATIANLQGDAVAALAFAAEAESLARNQAEIDRGTMQKGLALQHLGRSSEARDAMLALVRSDNDDWLRGSALAVVARLALDRGDLSEATSSIESAIEACRRMRESIAAEVARNPLAVAIRWWNPDRLARLEGTLELIETRRARRLGLHSAERSGRAATEHFEATGGRAEAGLARSELARHLSDRGELDRAIFLLERERAFARDMGDGLSALRRSVWLAEAYARKAACQQRSAAATELEATALRLLEEARVDTSRYPGLERFVDMGLCLAHWCSGRIEDGCIVARKLLAAGDSSDSHAPAEPRLVARLLVLTRDRDAPGLTALGCEARDAHYAIRAVECFAQATRCAPEDAAQARALLRVLVERLGGRCWLAAHPGYHGFTMF